jgi:hypothetical protein
MLVPKASMNENGEFLPAEHEIGFAWQIFFVTSVAQTQTVKPGSQQQFRRSVFCGYAPHILRAIHASVWQA